MKHPSLWGMARYHVRLKRAWRDLFKGWKTRDFWLDIVLLFAKPVYLPPLLALGLLLFAVMWTYSLPFYLIAAWKFSRYTEEQKAFFRATGSPQ